MAKSKKHKEELYTDLKFAEFVSDELKNKFNIDYWDIAIFGDGSGVGWDNPIGWSCALVDRRKSFCKTLGGMWSNGTIGIAELIPYIQAIYWYNCNVGYQLIKDGRTPLVIRIISDSKSTVDQGNDPSQRKALLPLWCAFESLCDSHYISTFHFMKRDELSLNRLADYLSKSYREQAKLVSFEKDFQEIDPDFKLSWFFS